MSVEVWAVAKSVAAWSCTVLWYSSNVVLYPGSGCQSNTYRIADPEAREASRASMREFQGVDEMGSFHERRRCLGPRFVKAEGATGR